MRFYFLVFVAFFALLGAASAAEIEFRENPDFFPGQLLAYCGGGTCQSTSDEARERACTPRVREALKKAYLDCDKVVVKFLACSGTPKLNTPYRVFRGVTYVPVCAGTEEEVKALLN